MEWASVSEPVDSQSQAETWHALRRGRSTSLRPHVFEEYLPWAVRDRVETLPLESLDAMLSHLLMTAKTTPYAPAHLDVQFLGSPSGSVLVFGLPPIVIPAHPSVGQASPVPRGNGNTGQLANRTFCPEMSLCES